MVTRTIVEILARKQAGIDCDDDESAFVKRYFDHLRRHGDGQRDVEMIAAFPLEWAEWCEANGVED